MTEPWTTAVSALLTPLVAVIAGYIAWQQWRTARNKLKLDLFDRRVAIYMAAQSLLVRGRSTKLENDALWKFLEATHHAKWLLNESVAIYLKDRVYNRIIDLQTLISEAETMRPGEERSGNIRAQRDARNAIDAELNELDRVFAPFIKISH